jgi:hypothetical protein
VPRSSPKNGSLRVNDGAPAVGREAIAKVAQGFMRDFPDMQVTMDRVTLDPHWMRVSLDPNGHQYGPGRHGQPRANQGYESGSLIARELIGSSKGHFDSAEYERQLQDRADGR